MSLYFVQTIYTTLRKHYITVFLSTATEFACKSEPLVLLKLIFYSNHYALRVLCFICSPRRCLRSFVKEKHRLKWEIHFFFIAISRDLNTEQSLCGMRDWQSQTPKCPSRPHTVVK